MSVVSGVKMLYGIRSLSCKLLRHIEIGTSARSASIDNYKFLECFRFQNLLAYLSFVLSGDLQAFDNIDLC